MTVFFRVNSDRVSRPAGYYISAAICLCCLILSAILSAPAFACGTNIAGVSCSSSKAVKSSAKTPSKQTGSVTIEAILSAPHMDVLIDTRDARHLLERSGIGAPPREIANLIGKSRAEAVQSILDGYRQGPQNRPRQWMMDIAPPHWAQHDMLNSEEQAFQIARDREAGELRNWWMKEMITTTSPQTERLTLFWQNHFVTTYEGLNDDAVITLARQNMKLRELAAGNFRSLVKMIIRDPAMLDYLDNDRNRKESPNENLARELMELFTLGEGQYDEATVKEAARALTGYSFTKEGDFSFDFRPWSHDGGRKNLFGKRGRYDGDDLVDIILEQPAAAEFIAGKFWQAFISEIHQDAGQISDIADLFRASDYDIKTLMAAILSSQGFWDEKHRATIVKSPVDLLVGTVRTTGYLPANWAQMTSMSKNLGQQFYGQPNVAGWPGGASWITPARLLNRWQAVDRLMTSHPAGAAKTDQMMMASGNDGQTMMANEMMVQGRVATVRVASEDYLGPPRWTLTLFNLEAPVWSSETQTVAGGHDTVKFGRIESDSDLNWQEVQLPITYDGPFDQISVRFINDAAGNDGDRNMFVDGVQIDGSVYPAALGRKRTSCSNDEREPWALWCAGSLILTENISSSAPELKPMDDDDRLYVGKVRMLWASEPPGASGRDNYDFNVGLQNVRFNGQELNHIVVRFKKDKRHGVTLRLSSTDCVPDCLTRWPRTAWIDQERASYGETVYDISIPLNGHSRDNHYGGLTADDKKFISAIWTAFPEIMDRAAQGRQARRKPDTTKAWMEWADSLEKRLASSRHAKLGLLPAKFEGLGKSEGMMMMSGGTDADLHPAGYPPLASWNAFTLPELLQEKPVADWLLAALPVQVDVNTDDIALLLSDPVYQLK